MKSLLHLFHRGVANLTGISQMYSPYLIHHFLENSAQRLPDKIAFIHEDVRATYAGINSKADRLAQFLTARERISCRTKLTH